MIVPKCHKSFNLLKPIPRCTKVHEIQPLKKIFLRPRRPTPPPYLGSRLAFPVPPWLPIEQKENSNMIYLQVFIWHWTRKNWTTMTLTLIHSLLWPEWQDASRVNKRQDSNHRVPLGSTEQRVDDNWFARYSGLMTRFVVRLDEKERMRSSSIFKNWRTNPYNSTWLHLFPLLAS